jgi:predicted MFS family arabinose efflux permease
LSLPSALNVNSTAAIAAAAILTAVGVVFFNAMPLVLGTAAEQLGLGNEQIGLMASAYMAGFTIMTVALVAWVRKVNWRISCAAMAAMQIVGFVLSTQIVSLGPLLAALFLAGLGGGGLFGIATVSLADTRSPDRNIGIATFVQVVVPAVVVLLLPITVIPTWGFQGVMVTLALLPAIAFLLLPWVVRESRTVERRVSGEIDHPPMAVLVTALGGALIFHSAAAAVWAFYERVGDANDIPAGTVGIVLSVALVAGGAGSLVPVFLHTRTGRFFPIVAAATLQIACLVSLVVDPAGSYLFAGPLFMFAWTVSIIFQLGGVAAADVSGRYSAAIPAVVGIAAILGPAAGGLLLGEGNFGRLLLSACGLIVLSVLPAVYVNRQSFARRAAVG